MFNASIAVSFLRRQESAVITRDSCPRRNDRGFSSRNDKALSKIGILFFTALFLLISRPVFAEPSPTQCSDSLEPSRVKVLKKLNEIEQSYSDMSWAALKHWETIYNPLWTAKYRTSREFAKQLQAEGQVLVNRYEHLADIYKEEAHDLSEEIFQSLNDLEGELRGMLTACSLEKFSNCIEPRISEILSHTFSLRGWIAANVQENHDFSQRVRRSLEDKPSDHPEFAFRYQEFFQDRKIRTGPQLLLHVRNIREALELDWVEEQCCGLCVLDAAVFGESLKELPRDPAATDGVEGNVVTYFGLNDALEEYDGESGAEEA